jgi:putative oxidoreductase
MAGWLLEANPFEGYRSPRAARTLMHDSQTANGIDHCRCLGLVVTRQDGGFTALQRLFSMFPNGWPGLALLLLRVAAGILLIHDGAVPLQSGPDLHTIIVRSVALAAGSLLLLGLWTPVAGVLVTCVEACVLLFGTADLRSSMLLGAVGAALVALGPGSLSIDARLFGRKRLDIGEP